jgi:hypothetical protein
MTGIGEEAGNTARSVITTLKDNPLTLALVVFNVIFVIVIFLSLKDERKYWAEFQNKLFAQQEKFAEMLYNCQPYPRNP